MSFPTFTGECFIGGRWQSGQGAYFDSPEGHNLEILTRPYGSGG